MLQYPLRVAVVGIGGFAGAHHNALMAMEETAMVRVVATCDPAAKDLLERRAACRFAERGVAVYDCFDTLVASHIGHLDVVTVASPIPCHADHHRACVEHGIACYLEKPPTLDPLTLEEMIAAEASAKKSTQVGFNYISQPWRLQLKKRIMSGEFGRICEVGFTGLWRRDIQYFKRNTWAGRLKLNNEIVLDSCCGNAMAHHVHNMLFHADPSKLMGWADPGEVTAELYRANAIEGADTIFAKGILADGVRFRLFTTHACEIKKRHREYISCENAVIEIPETGNALIRHGDGRIEALAAPTLSSGDLMKENLRGYFDYLVGNLARPATMLRDCRPFVHLNALLYIASGRIESIPEEFLQHCPPESGTSEAVAIQAVLELSDIFMADGAFPSEQDIPWAKQGGISTREQLEDLPLVLAEITTRTSGLFSRQPAGLPRK